MKTHLHVCGVYGAKGRSGNIFPNVNISKHFSELITLEYDGTPEGYQKSFEAAFLALQNKLFEQISGGSQPETNTGNRELGLICETTVTNAENREIGFTPCKILWAQFTKSWDEANEPAPQSPTPGPSYPLLAPEKVFVSQEIPYTNFPEDFE